MTTPPDRPTRPLPSGRPPPGDLDRGSELAIEDFRSLRRWLIALGILTLAALAVAVFALVRAEESDRGSADRRGVRASVRSLDERIEELEEDVERTSEESDAARLDRRLRRVEGNLPEVAEAAADARESNGTLSERVDQLSEDVQELRRQRR